MRECLDLKLSAWSTSVLPSPYHEFKRPEKETMSSELAGDSSFFLSSFGKANSLGRAGVYTWCADLFNFSQTPAKWRTSQYFEGELHPTFIFFSPSQFDLRSFHPTMCFGHFYSYQLYQNFLFGDISLIFIFSFSKLRGQTLHLSEWLFMVILAVVLHQWSVTKLNFWATTTESELFFS